MEPIYGKFLNSFSSGNIFTAALYAEKNLFFRGKPGLKNLPFQTPAFTNSDSARKRTNPLWIGQSTGDLTVPQKANHR